ncbi:unnamed protein product [Soboliphyme baturini]|uniref:PAZ domain-containing protein n=1 Tax=Soboliphyme baturini TaxID=241478 RepID=A0A183I9M7_9BILA|nr:unnamed protein product [Soboliphyme baturini]
MRIHQYSVQFADTTFRLTPVDKRRYFWETVQNTPDVFPKPFAVAFDGDAIMFTVDKIELQESKSQFTLVTMIPRGRSEVELQIEFKYVMEVYMNFKLARPMEICDRSMLPIQALDIIMTQGRAADSFFPFRNVAYQIPKGGGTFSLGGGKEVWHGLFTSCHIANAFRPLVNIDVTHAAFFKSQPVLYFMAEVLSTDFRTDFDVNRLDRRSSLNPQELSIFRKNIKGLTVYDTHRGKIRRHTKVRDVVISAANEYFDGENGKLTVAQYFKEKYKELQFPCMPCVVCGSAKKPIILPVEICYIAEKQKSSKKLAPEQTANMIKVLDDVYNFLVSS